MTDECSYDDAHQVLRKSPPGELDMPAAGERLSSAAKPPDQAAFQESLLNALGGADIQQIVIEEGRVVYVGNCALARDFRLPDTMIDAHPLLGSTASSDDCARLLGSHRQRLGGEAIPAPRELALVTKNGERREFKVAFSVVPDARTPRIIVIGSDITERRRAERDMKEAVEFADCIIKAVPDLLVELDGAGRYVVVWQRHQAPEQASDETLIGRNLRDLLGTEAAVAAIRQATLTGTAHGEAGSVMRHDGKIRWYEYFLSRMRKDSGSDNFLMLLRNVTERVRMHEKLTSSEQRYRSLVENLPDIVVRYDGDLRRSYVSPAYEQFTGQRSEAILGTSPFECWCVTSPADKNRAEYLAVLGTVMDTGRPAEKEFTFARADGKTVRQRIRYIPEIDNEGTPKGVLVVAQDVTAERALAERLQMTASVFGAAREGIIISNAQGGVLEVNPAFSRITGFERSEIMGARLDALLSGFRDLALLKLVVRSLRRTGYWSGEVTSRRKDGQTYTAQLDIVAVAEHPEESLDLFADRRQSTVVHHVVILSDITQLKQYQEHLRHVAYHDDLTGLPNRLLLRERLAQAVERAQHLQQKVAILYLDLDGFKPTNDVHGQATGDQILQAVGCRLAEHARPSDTVARIGGDEFVVVRTELTDLLECESAVRRFLDIINEPIELDGRCLTLSASVGVSLYPDDEQDPDTLLRCADHAMYSAKAAGRNRLTFYGSIADGKSCVDTQMICDLRQGIEKEQLVVYFQPIVDIPTGRIVEAEALVRWLHPTQGLLPPSVFIPIAEKSGLIHAVGEQVFRHAARVAQEWNRRVVSLSGALLRIAVNRSPRQFANRDDALRWLEYLTREGISGRMLGIEITESLLLEDRPEVSAQLEQLKACGMTVSLDDFGTGYSALSYLKKFDIDCIKIDRSFVRDIVVDESDRAIVEAIIAIGRRLGIKLIAEGVETREQAELLSAAGCDMAQGYFFAPPMREEEFLDFAASKRKFECARSTNPVW